MLKTKRSRENFVVLVIYIVLAVAITCGLCISHNFTVVFFSIAIPLLFVLVLFGLCWAVICWIDGGE